ncbi:MAG: caspase family protein [Planctomycetales bacterium]|nr:caspase family protein [Planctomycetales bacterium]
MAVALVIACSAFTTAPAQTRNISRERPDIAALGRYDAGNSPPALEVDTAGFSHAVRGLAFSPDDRLLAAAGLDAVRVWNLQTGRLVATLRGFYDHKAGFGSAFDVAFTPEGDSLVVAAGDLTGAASLRVYRVGAWDEIEDRVAGPRGMADNVAFSADGKLLASSGYNSTTGTREFFVYDWPRRKVLGSWVKDSFELEDEAYDHEFNDFLTYFGFAGGSTEALEVGADINIMSGRRWQPVETLDEVTPKLSKFLDQVFEETWPKYPATDPDFLSLDVRMDRELCLVAGNGTIGRRSVYWAALYSTRRADPLVVYRNLRYVPQAAALNRDCSLAAVADVFGDIHIWETKTGKQRDLFRSQADAVFRVGFAAEGDQIAFGVHPYGLDRWAANSYADLERSFDLRRRVLSQRVEERHHDAFAEQGGYQLQVKRTEDDAFETRLVSGGRVVSKLVTFDQPYCWSFLRNQRTGLRLPVVVGTYSGDLVLYDALPGDGKGEFAERRVFWAGAGLFTTVSETTDSRMLAAGNTDGVIRLYSLENIEPWGTIDVGIRVDARNVVLELDDAMRRQGLRVGDRLMRFQSEDYAAFIARGARDPDVFSRFREGQVTRLEILRDGRPVELDFRLPRGPDTVEPLLSLYVAGDDWVLWTPAGYYDASFRGDELIGWRVNRGLDEAAQYFPAIQFRKTLYRPDVIDEVLRTGDPARGVAAANAALPRPPEAIDFRDRRQFNASQPPVVQLLAPKSGEVFRERSTVVRAKIDSPSGEAVRTIKVLVNGRPVEAKAVVREDSEGSQVFEREIALEPGENQIAVVAATADAASQPAEVAVSYAPPVAPPSVMPKLYVLALGCSKYRDESLNLRYAAADARAFAETWQAQQGGFYREVSVKLLLDDEATSDRLRDGMDWLVRSATQHDVAVMFLSGHGVRDQRSNYYLATHDIDPARLRSTAVPHSDVMQLVEDMPCNVLLFVDTCHGGGVTGAKSPYVEDPWRDLVADEVGGIIFASSHPREMSLEDDQWRHGAFTKAFIDALGDAAADVNRDGYISVNELDLQLSDRVKQLTAGRQHPVTEKPATIRNFNLAKAPGAAAP